MQASLPLTKPVPWSRLLVSFLLVLLFLPTGRLHAQAGSLDMGFKAEFTGSYGLVTDLAVQPDGKVILLGAFTLVNGAARPGLARVNADGSLDPGFNLNVGTDEFSLRDSSVTVQPDGKVLLSDTSILINGYGHRRVIRLNADGSLDVGFNADTSAIETVAVLALQADGKILINGNFTQVGGTPRNGFARLNADGSLDAGFIPPFGNGYLYIFAAAVQPDGKIVVTGRDLAANGDTRPLLVRLNPDGSRDASFDAGRGLNLPYSSPGKVAVQADGKILLLGFFSQDSSQTPKVILRLNADGSLDPGFNVDTKSAEGAIGGSFGTIDNLVLQPDGKLILRGDFTQINGAPRNRLARVNADGSLDAGFNPANDANGSAIYQVALQADGKLILGGGPILSNGVPRNNVARLRADGSLDMAFDVFTGQKESAVYNVIAQPDGKVLLGGDFIRVNGVARNYLARLNVDGSLDLGFFPAPGTGGLYALRPDGKILTGGPNGLARLNADGSLDPGFTAAGGFLAVLPDGKILVRRRLFLGNGVTEDDLLRLNADGSLDATFHDSSRDLRPENANLSISSLTVQPDGKILLLSSYYLRRLTYVNPPGRLNADGTVDAAFHVERSALLDADPSAFAVQPNGKILVGLRHSIYSFMPPGGVARLNADGSRDASFNVAVADDDVSSVTLQANGKILVTGDFSQISGATRGRVARLNADGTLDAGFDASVNCGIISGGVSSVAVQADGQILLGGYFTRVNGVVRNGVARLIGDPPPLPPPPTGPVMVSVVGTPGRGGFVVSRTGSLDEPITVVYHNGGAAVRGVDYVALPGEVTLLAEQSEVVLPVTLLPGANRNRKVKVFIDPAPDGSSYGVTKFQSKVFLSDLP